MSCCEELKLDLVDTLASTRRRSVEKMVNRPT